MSVTVLYFARMAELVGCREEVVDPMPLDPAQLFRDLDRRHPLGFPRESLRVAVNDRLVAWESPLQPGDVVALIPPVSGG